MLQIFNDRIAAPGEEETRYSNVKLAFHLETSMYVNECPWMLTFPIRTTKFHQLILRYKDNQQTQDIK